MLGEDDPNLDYDEKKGFVQRVVLPGALVLGLVGIAGYGLWKLGHSGPAPRPHQELPKIVTIKLPPPPPQPPPRKQDEPRKQEEKQLIKQEPPKLAPKEALPPPVGLTATAGTGNDAFGLGVGNGEGDVGAGNGETEGYYNNVISIHVKDLLSRDDKLRYAVYRSTVAITFDPQGRAISAQIIDFSGEPGDRVEIERLLRAFSLGENLPDSFTAGRTTKMRLNSHEPG